MNKLLSCIEELQIRIKTHGNSLMSDELRTRVALIDPLLCALGWEASNPRVVTVEHSIEKIRVDYALLGEDGKPVAILEAKSLGINLSHKSRMQMLNYANSGGIKYAGLTNGDHWELYSVFKEVPLQDKKLLDISIEQQMAHHIALQLLCLWRPNLRSGKVTTASTPIVGLPNGPKPTPSDRKGWISLAKYDPKPKTSVPSVAHFWNGTERELKSWRDLLLVTIELLYKEERLTTDKLPYSCTGGKYLIHTKPHHGNGTRFRSIRRPNGTPFFMDANLTAKQVRRYCRKLLKDFGKDPKTDVHLKVM
ncbi:MAG: type I restriction enzyme HsdR N-terminal domain-containing protein [Bacteroidetes bacterium]|nr:type I restriction enzyme HsdR N-terminal domain-containing protein [Bacteroidota bacterium]